MLRFTTLRIAFLSALASCLLLLGMLASTGVASAHTATPQAPTYYPNPHISAYGTTLVSGNCRLTHVVGFGFAPGAVHLVAFRYGHPLYVHPGYILSGGYFSRTVIICGNGYGWWYTPIELFAIGPYGSSSNVVWL